MKNVFLISLGCPKNLTDTETMYAQLRSAGYTLTQNESEADVVLLNTCGFIQPAIEESETEIKRLVGLKKKGQVKKIVVAGCLVQRFKKDFAKKYPEIDAFLGVAGQEEILKVIDENIKEVQDLPRSLPTNLIKTSLTLSHTAYVKISDGCNHHCSFCTIPQIRGGYRSRPIDDIIREVNFLVEKGTKEISLVGQDTASYGLDLYSAYKLVDLIKQLAKISGLQWIRIMYAYPESVNRELIELIAGEDKVCKYLDMPIQHISDRVLQLMRRKTSSVEIRTIVALLKNSIKDVSLRTTVIAGFPGEGSREFNELVKFLKEVEFSKLGVFGYWQEKGTLAAGMPNQVSENIKASRVQKLLTTQSAVVDKLNKKLKGQEMTVICDNRNFGRSQYQAPDIDGGVMVNSGKLPSGDFARVKITGAKGYNLEGELIS